MLLYCMEHSLSVVPASVTRVVTGCPNDKFRTLLPAIIFYIYKFSVLIQILFLYSETKQPEFFWGSRWFSFNDSGSISKYGRNRRLAESIVYLTVIQQIDRIP